MRYIIALALLLNFSSLHAQKNENMVPWDMYHKLSINDFTIKSKADTLTPYFNGTFTIFFYKGVKLGNNYNKNVQAQMSKSASWLDTSISVEGQLRIIQLDFDIAEVYARKMRKQLREESFSKKKFLAIYDDIVTEWTKRRTVYYNDLFKKGQHSGETLTKWEEIINEELSQLEEFIGKGRDKSD
jgi:hypothetical protein